MNLKCYEHFVLSCSWQYRSLDHDIGFGVFFSDKDRKNSKDMEEVVCIFAKSLPSAFC